MASLQASAPSAKAITGSRCRRCVNGVLTTASGVSPGVSAFEMGTTMVLFTLIYGVLAVVEVRLLMKYIKLGLPDVVEPEVITDDDAPLSFAY